MEDEIEKVEKFENLEDLRKEIADIKAKEMERGKEHNPHFDFIEPQKLTNKDLQIYSKFLAKTLTKDEYYDYYNGFKEASEEEAEKDSSYNFCLWLANELMSIENVKWFYHKK